jgi:purine catabolism regulator
MSLSLSDVLAMPVLLRARPEVVCGDDMTRRSVRWVHTSEIYEIGPLLKGGELLLTTGLGLVGASTKALEAYVDALADRGVTAVCLELGRTFSAPPTPMLEAARRRGLVFIVLHGVVPFVEITEAVHHALVGGELEELRRHEQIEQELTDALLSGAGLSDLLRRIAAVSGCPAKLVGADGRVVATSEADRRPLAGAPEVRGTVEVFGVEWGFLVLEGSESPQRAAVLQRGVIAVALELLRAGDVAPARGHARRALMRDIASNRFASAADLAARARLVGFGVPRGRMLAAVALGADWSTSSRAIAGAAEDAARRLFGNNFLVAEVDGDVALAALVEAGGEQALRRQLEELAAFVNTELGQTTGGHLRAVVGGPLVADVPGLVRSWQLAHDGLAVARQIGSGTRVLLAADVGVYRIINRMMGDPEMEPFLDEQLGRLLDHDARYGRELVHTLDAYLSNGQSKTLTAQALGIRRQSVYARIAQIESLLGGLSLEDHERRTSLSLALLAWRLRGTGSASIMQ